MIASVTTAITFGTGLLMTVVDGKSFSSPWAGLWWAVQTVTTVGYGDQVPANTAGKLLAALVMLLGIGFVTVITASITSSFVAQSRQQQRPEGDAPPADELRKIDERLARIEAALDRRP